MKELKKVVLGIVLISSFSVNAQDTKQSRINNREVKSTELKENTLRKEKVNFKELSKITTKKLAKDLRLSKEQIELVKEIEFGIIQKNQSIRDNRELTVEEKQTYLKNNNQKRSDMIARLLTPEQAKRFQNLELKEKKELELEMINKARQHRLTNANAKLAEIATKKLEKYLRLSKEQIEPIRKIEFGILQKNQSIKDNRKLTTEEKQTYLKKTNQKRSAMILRVLNPKQTKRFKKLELKEKKAEK